MTTQQPPCTVKKNSAFEKLLFLKNVYETRNILLQLRTNAGCAARVPTVFL